MPGLIVFVMHVSLCPWEACSFLGWKDGSGGKGMEGVTGRSGLRGSCSLDVLNEGRINKN